MGRRKRKVTSRIKTKTPASYDTNKFAALGAKTFAYTHTNEETARIKESKKATLINKNFHEYIHCLDNYLAEQERKKTSL